MELSEFASLFERHNEEFLKFDRIETPRSARADLHAFLLLDELVPGSENLVSAARHDEFFLSVDAQALAAVASESQVVELIRCGVRFDSNEDALCMFA